MAEGRTLQELSDRLDIDDLLTRYAVAIDSKNFDLLDEVFTPDARIDYTSSGGIAGQFPEVKAWLASVLPHFPAYQHLVCNRYVTLDGDRATSVASFYNPMQNPSGTLFFVGGEYRDQLVRTPNGWRIAERIEVSVWTDGDVPAAPPA
jgi:3-phenylpropionate/cinnamic acid dioxygenase small subunit